MSRITREEIVERLVSKRKSAQSGKQLMDHTSAKDEALVSTTELSCCTVTKPSVILKLVLSVERRSMVAFSLSNTTILTILDFMKKDKMEKKPSHFKN